MAQFVIPLFVFATASSTATVGIKFPKWLRRIERVNTFYDALAALDGADVWTQQGATPLAQFAPGIDSLVAFTLPAVGSKTTQRNSEFICRPITPGHDNLFIRLRNKSLSSHGIMSDTLFTF